MKFVKIAGITALVLVALAVLGVTMAFAQGPDPDGSPWWQDMQEWMQNHRGRGMMDGTGRGMMGAGRGMMDGDDWGAMQQMQGWMHQNGGFHDAMWAALAEKLGLTAEELTDQVRGGQTLAQIAEAQGVSTADLAATMEQAMQAAVAQAVTDGQITQEQADQMLANMAGRYESMLTDGMGQGRGRGGMMGQGRGGRMGHGQGGCPNYDPDSGDSSDD